MGRLCDGIAKEVLIGSRRRWLVADLAIHEPRRPPAAIARTGSAPPQAPAPTSGTVVTSDALGRRESAAILRPVRA